MPSSSLAVFQAKHCIGLFYFHGSIPMCLMFKCALNCFAALQVELFFPPKVVVVSLQFPELQPLFTSIVKNLEKKLSISRAATYQHADSIQILQLHVATLQLESFPAVEFFTDINWLLLKQYQSFLKCCKYMKMFLPWSMQKLNRIEN